LFEQRPRTSSIRRAARKLDKGTPLLDDYEQGFPQHRRNLRNLQVKEVADTLDPRSAEMRKPSAACSVSARPKRPTLSAPSKLSSALQNLFEG